MRSRVDSVKTGPWLEDQTVTDPFPCQKATEKHSEMRVCFQRESNPQSKYFGKVMPPKHWYRQLLSRLGPLFN